MRLVKRAENWEKAYQAFQQVNFAAWDYETIKESMLDYLKLYFPEDFNDFIESSEFITHIEIFAYLGEQIAYRLDMNAHENFLSTAQRKESVLRLAKLLSYNASRNIPARGLVKLTSISTTERVFDSNSTDLSNKTIKWNDSTNPNWKEQFILVLNKVLDQKFGSVLPTDRIQVQDVVFELYTLNNLPLNNNVLKFNASVSGNSYQMEIVPVQLNEGGPYEKRPEANQNLNVMFLNDGLGDTSDNTGFFLFVKQGTLQRAITQFDGITPNQTYDVNVQNVNETDVWVNNIDPNTGLIINTSSIGSAIRSGEWNAVDVANAQNVIFNTNPNRNKYEIETLAKDQFRLIFGDGNFANIPSGQFEIWYRISANDTVVLPVASIQNTSSNITYNDPTGLNQTFSFSYSLVDPIQNAAPSEDIERIRRMAPAVYYTQDRMTTGQDYNVFPLQDNSILKLRAINRTFAGDSKYIHWHDASETYENVKIFGSDLAVYFKTENTKTNVTSSNLPPTDGGFNTALIDAVFLNYIQPTLVTQGWFVSAILKGVVPSAIRNKFNSTEAALIKTALGLIINNSPNTFYLKFDVANDIWTVDISGTVPTGWSISVTINSDGSWDIVLLSHRIVVHSDEINFWVTNQNNNVITYDTLTSQRDQIVILRANVSPSGSRLSQNYFLNVMTQELLKDATQAGLESIHDLHVIPSDTDQDGVPDNVDLAYLIGSTDVVYFSRECENCEWNLQPATTENIAAYALGLTFTSGAPIWKKESGVYGINFLWMHRTTMYHLIDPSPTNLIDMYIITRGWYTLMRMWLNGQLDSRPEPPTPLTLRNSYNSLLQNKMISDTVIPRSGNIKPIIGSLAAPTLRATIKVIRTTNTNLTDNQLKTEIVDLVNEFFDITTWEFGETFYFTELSAFIQTSLPVDVSAVVLVPMFENQLFGDLFQVFAREDEIIQPSISVSDIVIVESLNPVILKQSI